MQRNRERLGVNSKMIGENDKDAKDDVSQNRGEENNMQS